MFIIAVMALDSGFDRFCGKASAMNTLIEGVVGHTLWSSAFCVFQDRFPQPRPKAAKALEPFPGSLLLVLGPGLMALPNSVARCVSFNLIGIPPT